MQNTTYIELPEKLLIGALDKKIYSGKLIENKL
jgi:hypothetical protein